MSDIKFQKYIRFFPKSILPLSGNPILEYFMNWAKIYRKNMIKHYIKKHINNMFRYSIRSENKNE